MKLLVDAVLRAAVLIAAPALLLAWLERGMGESADADIGGGAMALLLVVVIAAVWSLCDGARLETPPLFRLWVAVLVLMCVGLAVRNVARGDLGPDLLIVIPIVAGAAGVPALIGGLVGESLKRGVPPTAS